MKRISLAFSPIILVLVGWLVASSYHSHVEAQSFAEAKAALDAGNTDPSMAAETHLDGNGPKVAPPVPVPSDSIDDPVKQPAAAWDDVKAAKKTGWTLALLVVVIMALRGLGYLKGLSFFKKDRVAIVVGGALVVATSLFDTLVLGGTWVAALYAAGGAVMIWWRSKHATVTPAVG
jgi:hypothetical protein